ncbi:GNAT family N-acetyltransferase [Chitinophaga vietnamensis]|uniref:GNAT family N-acetyltransferase n=1 Tax=Chitinophaga vietnamensis TaxID=2593957 RepID=UPI00117786B1|nr:GNAT family protein [Chitinophaga vietnamensis]
MTSFPTLHTARLDLIELTHEHSAELFTLMTDPRVTEYYNVMPMTQKEDLITVIDWFSRRFKDRLGLRWGIRLKDTGAMIGTIGYNTFTNGHKGVLVYALAYEHWNKGLMTEALQAAVRFGFDVLDLNRIEAEVMPGNTASERILAKSGFHHEGLLKQWMLWNGKFFDINMFALLREEYRRSV